MQKNSNEHTSKKYGVSLQKLQFSFLQFICYLMFAQIKRAAARKVTMNSIKEISQEECYKWWIKMMPMWKKWIRKTYLCGYDKDDLMQQSYIELVNCMNKYNKELGVPFESYYKMYLYQWRNNQSRKKRELLSITDEYEKNLMETKDITVDIEGEIENKLLSEAIIRTLEDMGEIEKFIITKYYMEKVSLKDIAKELNINYKTLEYKKKCILRKLREDKLYKTYY